jgi:hypothetical protein
MARKKNRDPDCAETYWAGGPAYHFEGAPQGRRLGHPPMEDFSRVEDKAGPSTALRFGRDDKHFQRLYVR